MKETVILEPEGFREVIDRLASEVAEQTAEVEPERLALVGVRTRGVPLSGRLATIIEERSGRRPALGVLDITLYRDDVSQVASQPIVRRTELGFAVDDAWIILVDDVLYTGRTARAAITALIDFGRPRKIELLALVDRGWRELPIQPDYVGVTVTTRRDETVKVSVEEEDGSDRVILAPAAK